MNLAFWRKPEPQPQRGLSFQEYQNYFGFNGHQYPLFGYSQTLPRNNQEPIDRNFLGLVQGAYKDNGVVFACLALRLLVFSEARFQFRRIRDGKPGDLFGTSALEILESPWDGGTTGDLLARMETDVSLAGNFFGAKQGNEIRRLRPDWVSIALGSNMERPNLDPFASVLGYVYTPGGVNSGEDPLVYLPEDVAHYAPIPDPEAVFRGMSWMEPVVREIMADKAATDYKSTLLTDGTPNIVIEFDKEVVQDTATFDKWVEAVKEQLGNMTQQHMALFLGAGAKSSVVGSNFQQLELKSTQGAGETRIAAAAGTPPALVGLSEGLAGSSLNAGNFSAARRRFADATMRPLWRNASASLAKLVNVPGGAELWFDERDIAFLREDRKDGAAIQEIEARTIRALVDGGYTPESVVDALMNEDWARLKHTKLFSVQLQPPGLEEPAQNGSSPAVVVPD